jgi:hypothetical protein
MGIRGWALLCGAECGDGEVWLAYIIGAGISTMVYVVLLLILGRPPLMIVFRVPGLWKAFEEGPARRARTFTYKGQSSVACYPTDGGLA